MPAPAVINRLPLVSSLLKWFKGDELTIDNALFKLHHQVKRTESRFSWDWVKFKQGYSTNIYLILPLFSRPAPLLWCLGSCSFSWKIIWTVEPLSAREETIMQGEQVYSWDEERVDEGVGAQAGGALPASPDLAKLSTMSVGMLCVGVRAKRPERGAGWPVTFKTGLTSLSWAKIWFRSLLLEICANAAVMDDGPEQMEQLT